MPEDYYTPRPQLSKLIQGGRVTIVCQGTELPVHQDLLSKYSPYFRRLFAEDSFREGREKRVVYDDLDLEDIERLYNWLHGSPVEFTPHRVLHELVCLYKLADRFDIGLLRNYCCRELLHSTFDQKRYPRATTLKLVYESLPESTPLRSIFVAAYQRFCTPIFIKDEWDDLLEHAPKEFLLSLVSASTERTCDGHNHVKVEEQAECRHGLIRKSELRKRLRLN